MAFNELWIKKFDSDTEFDPIGDIRYLYLDLSSGDFYYWDEVLQDYVIKNSGSGGGGSAVSSVFGRTGSVTAQSGDYSASQITNFAPTVLATLLAGLSTSTAQVIASTDTILQALGYLQAQISLRVVANGAITGATKTKITYDSKGLVTSGVDATTADIADSTNKRYQTDNQQSFNDATSSIQTQLNTKISKVGATGPYTTGQYYSAELNGAAGTTQALANNDFRGAPHKFQESFSFDRIRMSVSATGTATLCKIYIFDSNADETPKNTPIYTSADISIITTGLKEPLPVSITFNANEVYWICVQVNGTVTLDVKAAAACYNLGDSNNTQTLVGVRTILGSYAAITNFTSQVGAYSAVRAVSLPPKISFRKS